MTEQIGGQNSVEWNDFIKYLQDKNITSYLEIGAREGIALRYLAERLPLEFIAVVDLPGADWGRPKTERQLRKNLDSLDISHNIAIGDSTDPEIIESVRRNYDLIFIDGDHTYDGVKQDYENYKSMGGMLVFHDINQGFNRRAYGATEFWNEIKTDDSITFIAPGSQKGIGIL